uniref:Uncharacterized protein n=1 Tax=Felis catus TaxID=9685 RepID=A0ABI7VWP9_FELCA
MTSHTMWAEILSQPEEDIKKVMVDMQKGQRGEKHWLTLGDTSLPFFSDGPPGGRAPCKRAPSPALGAPSSPATLCHLQDHRKRSQRMLSPHSWDERDPRHITAGSSKRIPGV